MIFLLTGTVNSIMFIWSLQDIFSFSFLISLTPDHRPVMVLCVHQVSDVQSVCNEPGSTLLDEKSNHIEHKKVTILAILNKASITLVMSSQGLGTCHSLYLKCSFLSSSRKQNWTQKVGHLYIVLVLMKSKQQCRGMQIYNANRLTKPPNYFYLYTSNHYGVLYTHTR